MSDTSSNSERHELFETLLKAAHLDAENHDGSLLAAARAILARAEARKAERDMTPYDRGFRDARHNVVADPDAYGYDEDAQDEYDDGYNEGLLLSSDEVDAQIERDYLDGECTLSGNYQVKEDLG